MNIALTMMLLYFAVTIVIGLYYGRKETKTSEDFMVGGRRFSLIIVLLCMLATYIGAGTTIGTTSWVWTRGLSQAWFTIGQTIVFAFIGLFLAGKIQQMGMRAGIYTVADFVELRYNKASRYLTGALMWFAFMAITAFQYMGMGRIIETIVGIPYNYAVVLCAVVTIFYTSWGGLWSVAITEVFQGCLTVLGVAVMAPIVLAKAGGFSGIMAAVPPEHFSFTGYVTPGQALTWFMVFFLGVIPMQDWWQRSFAAKDKRAASKGIAYMALGFVFVELCIFVIGFAGKVLLPDIAQSEQLFPIMVVKYLNPWIGGVVLACLVSIIMSTASACLLVPSTHFVRDLWQGVLRPQASDEELLKVSKLATFIFGIAVLIFVFAAPSMFDIWVISADILGAVLGLPVLAGFFVPRVGRNAGFAGMLAGFIGWLIGYLGWAPLGFGPVMIGGIFSLIALLIGAIIFPGIERTTLIHLGFIEEFSVKQKQDTSLS
ncbi:MAG: sodium:solute symporter family protein [Peptococcaceae bacterium]